MVRKKLSHKRKRSNSDSNEIENPCVNNEAWKNQVVNYDTCIQIDASTQCIYNIGIFTIYLQDTKFCLAADTVVYNYLQKNSSQCLLCWKEVNETGESQMKWSSANCEVQYEALTSFKDRSSFNLVYDLNDTAKGHFTVNVYICPKLIIQLEHPSEIPFTRIRPAVQLFMKYFHRIFVKDYDEKTVTIDSSIEELYSGIKNSFNSEVTSEEVVHPFLIPKLRDYQTQAVRWMLKCEEALGIDNSKLHILFAEMKTINGHTIYYHKYSGIFVTTKFTSLPLCKGGILADEMGMGKTVEVLSCILLHPRHVIFNNENETSVQGNNGLTKIPVSSFECVCGKEKKIRPKIKCQKCGLIQHASCVLSKLPKSFDDYICPYCRVSPLMKPVPSGSTLIVTPSSILHQWKQELDNHIMKGKLKVLIYLGVEVHKFIIPEDLAAYDIVLSSYETFKKEVSHINVPHGESLRSLRKHKKFRTLPSPLQAVEWWRIVLDEAQMVESVATKTAQMALELHCVNRWCVTGTPIQKSFEDLYGLLLFLGLDPYNFKVWWKELISKPFISGDKDTLNLVMNSVLWRTSKSSVIDQINIPEQKTIVHEVFFSEIERVYYEGLHSKCETALLNNVNKYNSEDLNLRQIDKHILSKILLPLKNLHKTCSHFQLSGKHFSDIQRSKMTVPELLEYLLNKTRTEAEESHRQMISSLNGVAGVFAIQRDFKNSSNMYNKVLLSIKENKQKTIRTDVLQELHTSHNLAKLVATWMENENDVDEIKGTFGIEDIPTFVNELKDKSTELSNVYIERFSSIVQKCISTFNEDNTEISEIKSQFKCFSYASTKLVSTWTIDLLSAISKKEEQILINRIKISLLHAPGSDFLTERFSIGDNFTDICGLRYVLYNLSSELHEIQSSLKCAVNLITCKPSLEMVKNAVHCHLSPSPQHIAPKCLYCEAEKLIHQYESKLFRFDDTNSSDNEPQVEQAEVHRQRRQGTHSDSEYELVLKELVNYARPNKRLKMFLEDGINELKYFDALKKELKNIKYTWMKMREFVASMDEIEMAKLTMRELQPGEPENSDRPYIIIPHEIDRCMFQFEINATEHKEVLQKKSRRLLYLQNLQKDVNESSEETCPVCCQIFPERYSVLRCGHRFCYPCIRQLMNSPLSRNEFKCPICREITKDTDIYFINNSTPDESKMDVPIKGDFSAKISAVVKCLINICSEDVTSKSLVFSHWPGLLEILGEALRMNRLNYMHVQNKNSIMHIREKFSCNPIVNILLLPLNLGSNGLNIIEATHVLLIEPSLDNSKTLQAIGRVHRIGQTKETYVHKFVLKDTIDENIHQLYHAEQSTQATRKRRPETVKDLVQLLHVQ